MKEKIEYFLNNFNANEIDEYFCNGEFLDDCDTYFEKTTPEDVLDYLTDAFYTIDIDYRGTGMFADKVKETLLKALQMI